MSKIEVDLPDRIEGEINQMVAQDEFVNWDEAVEALLSRGVAAYDVEEEEERAQVDEELFQQSITEQQDPAIRDDHGDDHTF